jgi:hypothetical protein
MAIEMTKACDEDDHECAEDEIEQVTSEDVPRRGAPEYMKWA